MTIEAMKQAQSLYEITGDIKDINTLLVPRAAIEAAEKQEPVAGVVLRDGYPTLVQDKHIKENDKRLYTTPPAAQPAPAPGYCKHCKQYTIEEPLPAVQRQWVGLTDEEINEWTPEIHGVIQAIEAKLKEKNT